jgi:biopolymer transport protein ExbB
MDFLEFMSRGGDVLWGILLITIMLWWCILERLWYFFAEYPRHRTEGVNRWLKRNDRISWYALVQKNQIKSEIECLMMRNTKTIPTLIALLPLLGLLGTVTGMIQVFDVMASLGSGNPRAMANGVSAATIPTMAGMLVAISALPFWTLIDRRHKAEKIVLQQIMESDAV